MYEVDKVYPCVSFFFNDTATTEIYTLSLHDALPISSEWGMNLAGVERVFELETQLERMRRKVGALEKRAEELQAEDRKSTRLNSSHANISYAVFCLKKKKPNACIRSDQPSRRLLYER